jgi:Rieske Fe-S protein
MKQLVDGQVLPLEEVLPSRREFCRVAVAGAVLSVIPACGDDGISRIATGALEDGGGTGNPFGQGGPADFAAGGNPPPPDFAHPGPPPDFAGQKLPPDLAQPMRPPDLAMPMQSTCGANFFDTGKTPAQVQASTAVYVSSQAAFLCHDGNGYFAVSSICTHAGCTNKWSGTNNDFHCPCHGATFSLEGAVLGGPTNTPLDHYALCVSGNNTIGIDANTLVSSTKRYAF